jgi:hypothetical protein
MDGRGHDIVAALPHVYVIVGVDGEPQGARSKGRDDFVGIHVAAGAGPRLKYVYRKLIVMAPRGDVERRRLYGGREGPR